MTPNSTKDIRWNLKLLYASPTDPKIEMDLQGIENAYSAFAKKYDVKKKAYLKNGALLLEALTDFEKLAEKGDSKAMLYFYSQNDIDASGTNAAAQMALISDRLAKSDNKVTFFVISLGAIGSADRKKFLSDKKIAHFKVFLERIFDDASHNLSVPEENILNLKSLVSYDMWIRANEKILNNKTVAWKGKKWPVSKALQSVQSLKKQAERKAMAHEIAKVLESVAPISEAEINAVVTNKRINDDLRKYGTPYESTVLHYRNKPEVVENLVKTVTDNFSVAHEFYSLKKKILKLNKLEYCDRSAKIGIIKKKFPFNESVSTLIETFGRLNPKFGQIIKSYVKNGQMDVYPRAGKRGGAYCNHGFTTPVLLLLNHTDDFHSFTTLAHELGHAFHSELSRHQGPIYSNYSTVMAETASTLFESIALETVMEKLSDKEKMIVLHDKINDDISTIFRQIACFNFENDLHTTIRTKGYISKEEMADLHNENMLAYLGPSFKLDRSDGYMFVQWSHIRRFFYVYSYAFGMLVSKAFLRRLKDDPSFWKSIEVFLSAGGRESPENILKSIGVDVKKPEFFMDGLKGIKADIEELKKLANVK